MAKITIALLLLILLGSVAYSQSETPTTDENPTLQVYKSPNCGCCRLWVDHMQQNGYRMVLHNRDDLDTIKIKYGIQPSLQSCHTAITRQGYVFEGHIPAPIIKAFLKNPPTDARGLTVPGMPLGSPGMEVGNRFQPYQVLLLKKDGSTSVYARVNRPGSFVRETEK